MRAAWTFHPKMDLYMPQRASAVLLFFGLASGLLVAQPATLTSLKAVHALSNAQAAHHLTVDFQATVTYYRDYESTLFVQDGDVAIFVLAGSPYKLRPGDRIRVQGTTRDSFRPFVMADTLTLLGQGSPIKPAPATFDDLIHARLDCRLATIRARVLSADTTLSSDRRSIAIRLLLDGATADAYVDSDDANAIPRLLDADVQITAVVSGRFDGKMQMTGIVFHAQDLSAIQILKPASDIPWSLPVTPMDEILANFRQSGLSQRVRVQGTVTYYMPGSAVVLQNGLRSLWINTKSRADIKIGDQADATGFPDVHDGFLKLTEGEIQDSGVAAPLNPLSVTWRDLTASHHVFDLVSIDATVVAEVREAGQDEYDLMSEGHLFSAILRHPARISLHSAPPAPLKQIPLGSTVRVSGVCILEDSNPFNAEVPFDILLRSFDDIAVIAPAPWLTVTNLVMLVSVLLLIVLAVGGWGWTLRRKVGQQTAALATRIEAEAALERRLAQIEQRRSRILEDINGARPLAEVLEEIAELLSFRFNGVPCWCEIIDGARLGRIPPDIRSLRVVREDIPARCGPPLGAIFAAFDSQSEPRGDERQAFFIATGLATLAIETRRLYSDLVHRSEFDQLTDIHNRFSLDKQLETLIAIAREKAGIFGIVYVDLDEFKQVNDVYGHRVGDLYLQEVATRMKRQLRSGDMLARLGGDEFAVLVPNARNRADVEEIALRLENCFRDPFECEGYTLSGSASVGIALYPEDGATRDSLLSTADAAMYVAKYTRRHVPDLESEAPSNLPHSSSGTKS